MFYTPKRPAWRSSRLLSRTACRILTIEGEVNEIIRKTSYFRVAKSLEAIIREQRCMPATIAIIDGRVQIGLDDAQLEHLASMSNMFKIAERDLPLALALGRSGGTTVSATMVCFNSCL